MPDQPSPARGLFQDLDLRRLLCALLPAALVAYLGLEGGGFDPITYGRAGLVLWGALLLAGLAGALTLRAIPRRGLIVIALLAAFGAWTGLSMLWSESAARSAQELVRALTYLGVLVLFCTLQTREDRRLTLGSVAAGIGLIVAVALLSRMQPNWFPKNETLDLVFASEARLNYPLNYWNGLAGLIAIGTPLLLLGAGHARTLAARVASSAALPAFGLAIYLTISRGGALALAVALIALLALDRRRLRLAVPLAGGLAGALALIWAAEARQGFVDGLRAGDALGQGDEMMVLTIVVCAAAAALPWLAGRLDLGRAPARPGLTPRARLGALFAAACAIVVVALAAGAPSRISDGWEQFKEPDVVRDSARLGSASGNGRYQWWDAARRANADAPVLGIGAGTFQFWWAREGTIASQVVDAHSLYLESLGELGLVGFLLICGFVGGTLIVMLRFTRAAEGEEGSVGAAATAAAIAFATAAAIDWAWELPVLPVAFLIAAAALIGGNGAPRAGRGLRAGLAGLAAVAVLLILSPLLGAGALRSSQEAAAAGNLPEALEKADRAAELMPYSGPAELQRSLVLELIGDDLDAAAEAAEGATEKEATNWENWLALSRIEYQRRNVDPSIAAFRRARELNPNSLLFQEPVPAPGSG